MKKISQNELFALQIFRLTNKRVANLRRIHGVS